jgi:hypothetical protein
MIDLDEFAPRREETVPGSATVNGTWICHGLLQNFTVYQSWFFLSTLQLRRYVICWSMLINQSKWSPWAIWPPWTPIWESRANAAWDCCVWAGEVKSQIVLRIVTLTDMVSEIPTSMVSESQVSGCMQLHGPAKSLQMAQMSHENRVTRQVRPGPPDNAAGHGEDLRILPSDKFKSLLWKMASGLPIRRIVMLDMFKMFCFVCLPEG